MKKTVKKISMLCLGLVIATSFVACNLDSSMGIFEAIGNSEPVLDTTNQSILGFDDNYVYVKAQDGIYKYGSNNSSEVTKVPGVTVKTNGFASSIGDPTSATAFVYQESEYVLKKYTLKTGDISSYYSITTNSKTEDTTITGMNNGMVLLRIGSRINDNEPWTYTYKVYTLGENGLETEWTLPANSSSTLQYGPGILFGFSGAHALTTMITGDKTAGYTYSYYWDNSQTPLAFKDSSGNNPYTKPDSADFLRIQAFQPATNDGGLGVAIAKVANDNYKSYIFVQKSGGGDLEYVGQSNFYLNYYSPSSVPSVRVTIDNTQYMLLPYSSGLRLIDLSTAGTIKDSATNAEGNKAGNYAYASSNTTSFAKGFTYNNVVDIKLIPDDISKTKYLVSTVNSGVYTITLPSEVGTSASTASDDTKNGERATGYHPISSTPATP